MKAPLRFLLAASLLLPLRPTDAFDPWAGDLSKEDPAHVRVMTHNVLNQFPAGTAAQTAAHERLLRAIQPDIISYQEVDPGTTALMRSELERILGGTWTVREGLISFPTQSNVNVLASRWPQSMNRTDTVPASSTRGVVIGLVDLPDGIHDRDFYVMGVHFKCCSGTAEDAARQQHADAVAAWMGDARTPGGRINLPPGTPMLLVGDVNFIPTGSPGPRQTLLEGTIQDTVTYGPPIKGDWDGTDNTEALPLDVFTMDPDTYSSGSTAPSSRLDRFFHTDSAATIVQGMVVNTLTMPSAVRTALGLQSGDTAAGSDHLPVFVDYAVGGAGDSVPLYGDVFVTEFMPDPTLVPDADGEWLELYNRTGAPVDLDGWVLRDSGTNLHVIRRAGGLVVPARSHLVMAISADPQVNGSVPAAHAFTTGLRLANSADTIELYRGSVKVDGIQYNGGPAGLDPANRPAGATRAGVARAMQGDYRRGATDTWGDATRTYNGADLGTPGLQNGPGASAWLVH